MLRLSYVFHIFILKMANTCNSEIQALIKSKLEIKFKK